MESRSHLNKTSTNFKEKSHTNFAASTMSQNFFNSNDVDDFDYPSISKSQIIPKKQSSRRAQSRKRMQQTKLQPAKQSEKVDIFKSSANNNHWDDLEEIVFQTPKKKQIIPTTIHTQNTQRVSLRRRNSLKPQKKQQIMQVPTIQKKEQKEIFQQPFQQKEIPVKRTETKQQKAILLQQQPIFLPIRTVPPLFKDEQEQNQKCSLNYVTGKSSIFDYKHQPQLIKQIFAQLKDNTTIQMEIIRDKGGFNRFWPQFHLRFADDKQHLMSAKKTSSRPASTFIISRSIVDFDQNSTNYLGKVKSNVLGDTYNIFGPGPNPSNASQKKVAPRELLATLMYNTSLFYANGPRKFSVFTKKPQIKYYQDFDQVRMYEQEISLSTLYSYQNNKQKIDLSYNKKPIYNQKNKTYFLDFKGKAPITSVKNFILQQKQDGPQTLLFGKTSEDCFNLQISSNISPYVAFAVAIASFDNRLVSQ